MSVPAALLALTLGAVGTYFARSGLILLLADRTLPAPLERALQNVGPAVLAALTINLAVGSGGIGTVAIAEGAALLAACVVAVWRRNMVWTLLAGLSTLWIVTGLS